MKYEVRYLSPPQKEGARVCFLFQVSSGTSSRIAKLWIPIEFNGTAEALGVRKVPQFELIEFGTAWLNFRLGKGNTDATMDVPLGVLDHWRDKHSIPDWL